MCLFTYAVKVISAREYDIWGMIPELSPDIDQFAIEI